MAILYNSNLRTVIHEVANASYEIAGNTSVSNVASANQVVYSGSITRVWFGADPSGSWQIKRGGTIVYTASGAGFHYFDGAALSVGGSANLSVELIGTANGFIQIELKKQGTQP